MEFLLMVVLVAALLVAVGMSVFAWRVLRRDRERTNIRVARLRALAAPSAPEPDVAPAGTRWGTMAVVVVVFMSIGAGTVYALYGSGQTLSWPVAAFASVAETPSPLELVSLSHRREPDGDFVITGLVQNPVGGRTTQGLVAVVYLFDADGQYFTSAKSAIEVSALVPGDQSPFLIRLSNIAKVSRYRVGFRLGDDDVYAHVDRRGAPLVGTTAAVAEETR